MKYLLLFLPFLLYASPFKNIDCDKIINKKVIDICYDYKVKGAKYVSYTLNGEKVNEVNLRKRPKFYTEKNIPKKYATKYSDYTYSIGIEDCNQPFTPNSKINPNECEITYDRGHLAPDADFDYNKKDLTKIYTMANIIPQVSVVNQKTWTKVELYERQIASKLGLLNVITGVEYKNKNNFLVKKPLSLIKKSYKWKRNKIYKYYKQDKYLRKKKIIIPSAFWKHYTGPNGFEKCFFYENKLIDPEKDKLRDHEVSCSSIENLI